VNFSQLKLHAEGALSVGRTMHDGFMSTVNAGNPSGSLAGFVTPKKAHK